ncbi:MAG: hypothetical protein C6H99_00820, partial [Epsilonproteobacteria bacterium]|nr:hypothetical protein [Campylobacterota bacterium]NPA64160.1 hypothetical protein [Campylobacterota bacterium]
LVEPDEVFVLDERIDVVDVLPGGYWFTPSWNGGVLSFKWHEYGLYSELSLVDPDGNGCGAFDKPQKKDGKKIEISSFATTRPLVIDTNILATEVESQKAREIHRDRKCLKEEGVICLD